MRRGLRCRRVEQFVLELCDGCQIELAVDHKDRSLGSRQISISSDPGA
jgi:hypothetical protein